MNIRFGIGGEADAYLDVDAVKLTKLTGSQYSGYMHDSNSRLKTIIDLLGNKIQYEYDLNGNLLKKE